MQHIATTVHEPKPIKLQLLTTTNKTGLKIEKNAVKACPVIWAQQMEH